MTEDRDLVVAARQGDRSAFRSLYDRHRPAVFRLAQAFGRLDDDEVADVVQDTFVHAYGSLEALRVPDQFRPWLLSIARHRCLNYRQSENQLRKVVEQLGRQTELPHPGAHATLEREQEAQLVRDLIGGLPEGVEKQTAVLFYVEGELSVREIAERQGETKSAVGMRLERFRTRIKRRLLAHLGLADSERRKAGS
jgi:RNA polymerase sigma-70 factor (ECF subfamily)